MQAHSKFRACCFLTCLLLMAGCNSGKPDPKAEAEVLAHSVPVQSTPAQVIADLDQRQIEHSQYQRSLSGGGSIEAVIRDKSKWDIVRSDYGIVFHFDDKSRLCSVDIEPHYTGP